MNVFRVTLIDDEIAGFMVLGLRGPITSISAPLNPWGEREIATHEPLE